MIAFTLGAGWLEGQGRPGNLSLLERGRLGTLSVAHSWKHEQKNSALKNSDWEPNSWSMAWRHWWVQLAGELAQHRQGQAAPAGGWEGLSLPSR